jgi:hypothetical protein
MSSEKNGAEELGLELGREHDKKIMVLDLLQYFKPKYSKMLISMSYETVKVLHDNLRGRSKI